MQYNQRPIMTSAAAKQAPILPTEADPRWARVLARDSTADGKFWYSVSTTGVYCRPSCPSRRANPGNVRFHDSPTAARAAGFRACKRCRPDDSSARAVNVALVAKACCIIEQTDGIQSLRELAAAVDRSPAHFHRLFKQTTGLTPRDYAVAQRAHRVRKTLARERHVTDAIYQAGFNSSSRFYERAGELLGMSTSRYRAGGSDENLRFAIGESSLGAILVASSEQGVVAIALGDDPDALLRDLQDRFPNARLIGSDKDYEKLVATVVGYVEAPAVGLDLPLDIRGTVFQRRVWQALRKIPFGTTASYKDIATHIGSPTSTRAVANACAANKIALAIPCHRVVRTDGALSGYAWGVERKRVLLEREAANA